MPNAELSFLASLAGQRSDGFMQSCLCTGGRWVLQNWFPFPPLPPACCLLLLHFMSCSLLLCFFPVSFASLSCFMPHHLPSSSTSCNAGGVSQLPQCSTLLLLPLPSGVRARSCRSPTSTPALGHLNPKKGDEGGCVLNSTPGRYCCLTLGACKKVRRSCWGVNCSGETSTAAYLGGGRRRRRAVLLEHLLLPEEICGRLAGGASDRSWARGCCQVHQGQKVLLICSATGLRSQPGCCLNKRLYHALAQMSPRGACSLRPGEDAQILSFAYLRVVRRFTPWDVTARQRVLGLYGGSS